MCGAEGMGRVHGMMSGQEQVGKAFFNVELVERNKNEPVHLPGRDVTCLIGRMCGHLM